MTKWLPLFVLLLNAPYAWAVTLPYSYSASAPIRASEANANEGALRDAINTHAANRNAHSTRLQDILSIGNACSSTPIDFNLTQALNLRMENVSSDPSCAAGSLGRMIWNSVDGLLKVCNGSTYVSIAGTGVNTLASVLSAGNSAGSSNLDLNGHQLLTARVENLSSDPAATAGRLIYRTDTSELKISNGTIWTALGGAQGLSSVLGVSASAGSTNINFNGTQAVNARGENLGSDPATTTAGRFYYSTASGKMRYYDGTASSWKEIGNTNTLAQVMVLGASLGSTDLDVNERQLLHARVENLAAPPGTGNAGRLYFDTITSQVGYDTGSANKYVCSLDDTQTLTNKTISGSSNTLSNIPDAALSSNVVLKTGTQTISGAKTFSSAPIVGGLKTPSGASHTLTDGLANDTIVLANAVQTLAGKTLNAPSLSGNLDFNNFQAVEMRAENVTADPTPGSAGRIVYKSTTGELLYENGTSWFALGVNTTPTWDTVLAAGNSAGGNNVDINNNEVLNVRIENVGALPATGNQGRLVFYSGDGRMYVDNGSAWKIASIQTWAETLANGASAGATNPDFNHNEALKFRVENLGSDPAAAHAGRLYFNTASSSLKLDNGSAIVSFLDDTNIATLTNKSLDGADNTFSNLPDSSLVESYLKADGSRALSANWNAGAHQITANGVQVGSSANTIRSFTSIDNAGSILTVPTGISDTLVTRTNTETLTNKTISASSNTISNIGDSNIAAAGLTNAAISSSAAIARSKLASGSNNHVLINDGSGVMSSEANLAISRGGTGLGSTPTNGQLLIGNGTNYTLAGLTGTSNQITVTGGSGSITLATPQNIHTAATPTFAGLTLSGPLATQKRDESSGATVNALATSTSYVKLTATVTTINGAASGADGKQLVINNATGSSVTINHESGSASAADRFKLPNSSALILGADQSATFIYDSGASRWVQAGGGSGSGSESVSGSRASPNNIVAGTGITGIVQSTIVFVQGSGGHVTVTASPQIDGCSGATTVGRRVTVVGRNDSQVVILSNGLGLELNGPWTGGASDVLSLLCDGTSWVEVSRNN